jgi:hypothetical protein
MARPEDLILAAIEADLAAISIADEAARIVAARTRNPDDLIELALIRTQLAAIRRRCTDRQIERIERNTR